jgi:hypothetical protein
MTSTRGVDGEVGDADADRPDGDGPGAVAPVAAVVVGSVAPALVLALPPPESATTAFSGGVPGARELAESYGDGRGRRRKRSMVSCVARLLLCFFFFFVGEGARVNLLTKNAGSVGWHGRHTPATPG